MLRERRRDLARVSGVEEEETVGDDLLRTEMPIGSARKKEPAEAVAERQCGGTRPWSAAQALWDDACPIARVDCEQAADRIVIGDLRPQSVGQADAALDEGIAGLRGADGRK